MAVSGRWRNSRCLWRGGRRLCAGSALEHAAGAAPAARASEAAGLRGLQFREALVAAPRALRLYSAAFLLWWDYRRTGRRAECKRRELGLSARAEAWEEEPAEVEAMWEAAHERNAPRVRRVIDRLRGLWVKIGQYLSSRPDVVPAPYIRHLSGLQDAGQASPWRRVALTLSEELGPSWKQIVEVDAEPLATASVAQVHRGRLRCSGETVAVKVQHRGVGTQMRMDLVNLDLLVGLMRRFDADQDWRPVVSEWSVAVRQELDFVQEAANLREVALNLERSSVKAIVPKPKDGLVTPRVLIMDFCAGVPARDPEILGALGVNCELLVERVCVAFAAQIHGDGFFNADPHPGNVHVSTDPAQNGGDPSMPILMDYGLTKRFSPEMRLAFARLLHASEAVDADGLERALEEMGFLFEREPLEDLANMRRLFTAVPKSQAAALRRQRAGERRRGREEAPAGRRRRPVAAWPVELVFFLRVTGLLKGLAASLDVPVDYMGIMARAARGALRAAVPRAQRSAGGVLRGGDPQLPAASAGSPLQRRLESALEQIHGALRGLQVAVAGPGGALLASVCAGELGAADPRPVRPDSLFCVFSAGKAPCAAALLRLVGEGRLRLEDPVPRHWPGFAAEGKGACTVEHVLRHRAGLATALPEGVTLDQLLDLDAMVDFVAGARPASAPGAAEAYHALTFGWLLAGLARGCTGQGLAEVLQSRVVAPLGLSEEMLVILGVPQRVLAQEGRLATLEVAGGGPSQGPQRGSGAPAVPLLS
ncbi:unnamed protein product [Prorocentrum cordatum]|uniref:ABC1 atypical kinase-like domain-containing protein n=1 Tax=Prorocentrum cordatum TaxID=2364126 RepID=A0ABN9TFT3_9DINO|nr:unnamed protein product [Polarella glacialis]